MTTDDYQDLPLSAEEKERFKRFEFDLDADDLGKPYSRAEIRSHLRSYFGTIDPSYHLPYDIAWALQELELNYRYGESTLWLKLEAKYIHGEHVNSQIDQRVIDRLLELCEYYNNLSGFGDTPPEWFGDHPPTRGKRITYRDCYETDWDLEPESN